MDKTMQRRKLMRIDNLVVAKPRPNIDYRAKALAAEPTGKGNTLIVDGFFGRMFRSDVGCVKDELSQFADNYYDICRKLDEDPAHEYYEAMSWNDLYYLHGIIPGLAQDSWGYTNSEDYRVSSIDFETRYVEDGEWFEMFGEPYFYYCPKEHCFPDPCYLEV